MLSHTEIKELIQQQGVLPLFFHEDADVCIEVLKALYEAGIRIIEYTNRGETALKNFKALKDFCASDYKDMILAVGTVKSADAANAFINAGADFLISPAWIDEVFTVSKEKNILWIPGCMTSTEIAKAEANSITMIKLFPGSLLGPSYVSAIKEVFPGMQFMPTGGVSLDKTNLEAWFKSGVAAVGIGSKLITKDILALKKYAVITSLTRQAIDIIKYIRST
ncbi:MAG TPA: bifunctional 4-hydroxy-2-oxoglutarate aldolase/2-dehydro-3-deoxy-phosphogluconate aldolase [Parafilimonas sp.]|nr:bifunctional 4-hydroxy-2-oxoglutarate aldolase/2-dehydro-3-deoxy-phosphogluconate aldolase [Parafilimonas sp.]